MTRRPDPPEPLCGYCQDWGTVRDPSDTRDTYTPCPYCQPGTPQTSHQRTIAALLNRTGRKPR